jgi:DNA-binding transcriptional regulator YiaG
MPNIASVLKDEISRLARREVRQELQSLKNASAAYRTDIASLKKRIKQLEQQTRQLAKGSKTPKAPKKVETAPPPRAIKFSAEAFAALRIKLGLSAKDMGRLLGVSDQSINKWEGGNVMPRAKQLESIAAIRRIGKREALARLAVG